MDHLHLRAGDTLLDFGCGTGELCDWLPAAVRYVAWDWSEGMLRRVRNEHERAIVLGSLHGEFDHVAAVGTFNLRDGWSHDQTWQELARLWLDHARKSLIVCFYRGADERCLAYAPVDAVRFAEALGCRDYTLDAGYLPNDFLIHMRR